MADDRLDGRAAAHLSLDRWRHPSLLPGCIDFELVVVRRVVAAVSGIGMEPFDGMADKSLDRRDDASQRMAVIGLAGQRLRVADALHFGRMQAVDLGPALSSLLGAYAARQAQQMSERRLQPAIAVDLAGNVADDAAKIGLERAQSPVGALELLGMSVTLMLDQGELADPRIRLPQLHAQLFRQLYQLLARPV